MSLKTSTSQKKQDISLESLYQQEAQTSYNICTACEGYDTCTFPMNLSKPLLHCAEFKPFSSRGAAASSVVISDVKAETTDVEKVEYIGLCRNCDLRDECVNCKPGKHVLNCGEYQ